MSRTTCKERTTRVQARRSWVEAARENVANMLSCATTHARYMWQCAEPKAPWEERMQEEVPTRNTHHFISSKIH